MASDKHGGTSALDRLRSRYDTDDLTCPKCGYEDEDGAWGAETSGDRVRYRHVCPACGHIRKRTLRLG